jgi:YVTN family beta-propeller protein
MSARSSEALVTGSRGLEFRVLGPLEASRDGIGVELGPRKQRAVLALLLLNANRVVPTERLIDNLWGESPPETARSALQVYVAGLRKALGADGARLRTKPPGYVLDVEPGALDLDRFTALRAQARSAADDERRSELLHEALELWRDTPLAELRSEPFSATAAGRLEELRLAALEERIDADLALGRHTELVAELEQLVAEHPYRERMRAQLMLALYRSGRQADALDAYQHGRRVLRDELGLEPGRQLRELEAAILRHDASVAAPALKPEFPPAAVFQPDLADVPPAQRLSGRRGAAVAVVLLGLLAAAALAVVALRDEPAPVAAPANSVALIDPKTNKVIDSIGVGLRPGPIASGEGSVWIGNLDDRTLSRIDLRSRRVTANISLGATPTGVAVGEGAVWVAHGLRGQLSRVDSQFDRVTDVVALTGKSLYFPTAGVAVGGGSVWVVFGDSTFARVDSATVREVASTLADMGPAAVGWWAGSVWVANAGASNVQRFSPRTFEQGPVQEPISVGGRPTGIAFGHGAVWVASSGDDVVTHIDPGSRSTFPIRAGVAPTAVAVGEDAVWAVNSGDGTVSRIDPVTRDVVETIELGNVPVGIAVVDGLVWVTLQEP